MGWFEVGQPIPVELLEEWKQQVIKFNTIAGKEYDSESQVKLCYEEAKELIAEYEVDKSKFLKECLDCVVVSCLGVDYINEHYEPIHYIEEDIGALRYSVNHYTLNELYMFAISTSILTSVDADCKGAMKEVLSSNMSKFSHYCPQCIPEYDEHCKTLEADGRYKGVTWNVNEGYVYWMDENKKILKGNNYREADVSKYVY